MRTFLKLFLAISLCTTLSIISASLTQAQTVRKPSPTPAIKLDQVQLATDSASASATLSAQVASPAAALEQVIQAKTEKDITETTSKKQDKLLQVLEANPIGSFSWYNFLQHGIRRAINNGMPANILVLILLFPIITAVISFSRHVIGLKGFGVYTPAVLSVAFVSTGIFNGILMFLIILISAMVMKKLLKKLNMQALPRTAMLLWGVSIVTLTVLILSTFLPLNTLLAVNIFPLLIIMLLTENFMDSQLSSSQSEALSLTVETLLIAIFCSFLIGSEWLQNFVILQPEIMLILVGAINIIVGKYTGLRLMEWVRFRTIIE